MNGRMKMTARWELRPPLRVGVLGASGLVGRQMVRDLESSFLDLCEVHLWATERGAGEVLSFRGKDLSIEEWHEGVEGSVSALLLATKADVSRRVGPPAAERGVVVIDNSSAFRMEPDVPLVVPEVNPDALGGHRGLIANPNCSTIQLAVALAPLHRAAVLERVIVSTYQSVSGVGRDGLITLDTEEAGSRYEDSPFPRVIRRNVIPQCDVFVEEGWTREEWKMKVETRKILNTPRLRVDVTCVRVPVAVGHSESVTVDLERPLDPEGARRLWKEAPGVVLQDYPEESLFPVPVEVYGRPEVFIGRVRGEEDFRTLHFWVVADNLTKGAATNAVQILESLVSRRDVS
jgi:aspartate-semialdehyde dehydrogenase